MWPTSAFWLAYTSFANIVAMTIYRCFLLNGLYESCDHFLFFVYILPTLVSLFNFNRICISCFLRGLCTHFLLWTFNKDQNNLLGGALSLLKGKKKENHLQNWVRMIINLPILVTYIDTLTKKRKLTKNSKIPTD